MVDYEKAYKRITEFHVGITEEEILTRLKEPWEGMEKDIMLLEKVLQFHAEASANGALNMIDNVSEDGESVTLPDWMMEAIKVFQKSYPNQDEANFRYQKASFYIMDKILPNDPEEQPAPYRFGSFG